MNAQEFWEDKARSEKTLREVARTNPVVTLTGPRQSGKTTLCRMAFPDKPYANLELPDVRDFALSDPRGFLAAYPDGAVLDEVQRAPDLLSYIQSKLAANIKEVRFSKRLTESPACIVLDEMGMTRQMQDLFKAMGKEAPQQKNILELNPNHSLLAKIDNLFKADPTSEKLTDYIVLLYDQSLLTAGFKIKDPMAFSKRLTDLMVAGEN